MAVLALDLATTTGWALHKPGMQRPFFGAIRFSSAKGEIGAQLVKFHQFLVDQHQMHKLTDVVFEASLIPFGKINPETIYRLISLAGHAEYFAHRIGARCFKVELSSWRKHFIGRNPAGGGWKKDAAKKAALDACSAYGWATNLPDAAEACGILDFYLSLIPKYDRPWRDATLLGGIR